MKSYGTFTKQGGHVFRTSAYIQWGSSEHSLGACLLLNPGAAVLDGALHRQLEKEGQASGKIEVEDPTMRQLISIVEEMYKGQPLNGRLHIYNLFPLRETSSEKAIATFESLVDNGAYSVESGIATTEEMSRHPWILVGWGLNQGKKNLRAAKQKWLEAINEAEIPMFHVKSQTTDDYYHLSPLIHSKKVEMRKNIVAQYRHHIGFQRFTAHAAEMNLMVEADPEEPEESHKSGWQISRHNPEHIVQSFSQLQIKEGYQLRGYQFTEGGNGNGIVWALKDGQELPPPEKCPRLDDEFLNPPKPDKAFDDFMVAVEGDRSPFSYLQAAICSHELYEFGAMWHGISWGREQVMGRPDDEFDTDMHDWEMVEDKPDIIEPYFYYNRNGHPVVVYHTTNDIGVITWNRYMHTFSKDDYTARVEETVIATAGAGIIF